jgi:hypothetical protein
MVESDRGAQPSLEGGLQTHALELVFGGGQQHDLSPDLDLSPSAARTPRR